MNFLKVRFFFCSPLKTVALFYKNNYIYSFNQFILILHSNIYYFNNNSHRTIIIVTNQSFHLFYLPLQTSMRMVKKWYKNRSINSLLPHFLLSLFHLCFLIYSPFSILIFFSLLYLFILIISNTFFFYSTLLTKFLDDHLTYVLIIPFSL